MMRIHARAFALGLAVLALVAYSSSVHAGYDPAAVHVRFIKADAGAHEVVLWVDVSEHDRPLRVPAAELKATLDGTAEPRARAVASFADRREPYAIALIVDGTEAGARWWSALADGIERFDAALGNGRASYVLVTVSSVETAVIAPPSAFNLAERLRKLTPTGDSLGASFFEPLDRALEALNRAPGGRRVVLVTTPLETGDPVTNPWATRVDFLRELLAPRLTGPTDIVVVAPLGSARKPGFGGSALEDLGVLREAARSLGGVHWLKLDGPDRAASGFAAIAADLDRTLVVAQPLDPWPAAGEHELTLRVLDGNDTVRVPIAAPASETAAPVPETAAPAPETAAPRTGDLGRAVGEVVGGAVESIAEELLLRFALAVGAILLALSIALPFLFRRPAAAIDRISPLLPWILGAAGGGAVGALLPQAGWVVELVGFASVGGAAVLLHVLARPRSVPAAELPASAKLLGEGFPLLLAASVVVLGVAGYLAGRWLGLN